MEPFAPNVLHKYAVDTNDRFRACTTVIHEDDMYVMAVGDIQEQESTDGLDDSLLVNLLPQADTAIEAACPGE